MGALTPSVLFPGAFQRVIGVTRKSPDQLPRPTTNEAEIYLPPFFTQESLSATVRLKTGFTPGSWSLASATK